MNNCNLPIMSIRVGLLVLWILLSPTKILAQQPYLSESIRITKEATRSTSSWPLPPPGPMALHDKTVVYIGEDFRNAGILAVATGVRNAARAIGWKVHFLDLGSNESKRQTIFKEALALEPDGIILGGLDGRTNASHLSQFQMAGIPVVGWHVGPFPGPVDQTPILVNVTTDSIEVARVAAHYIIANSNGRAATIIFTDSKFAIALEKSSAMEQIIRSCEECTVLEVKDIALNNAAKEMPLITEQLLEKYGSRWNYSLGINDLYYDHIITSLVMSGNSPDGPPFNISAGDGSPSAFLRIQNASYQMATIPEPVLFHGWQLVDELNRLLSNHVPSGYITPAHIVSRDNIWSKSEQVNLFDPKNGYRDFFINTWKGKKR